MRTADGRSSAKRYHGKLDARAALGKINRVARRPGQPAAYSEHGATTGATASEESISEQRGGAFTIGCVRAESRLKTPRFVKQAIAVTAGGVD